MINPQACPGPCGSSDLLPQGRRVGGVCGGLDCHGIDLWCRSNFNDEATQTARDRPYGRINRPDQTRKKAASCPSPLFPFLQPKGSETASAALCMCARVYCVPLARWWSPLRALPALDDARSASLSTFGRPAVVGSRRRYGATPEVRSKCCHTGCLPLSRILLGRAKDPAKGTGLNGTCMY